MRKYFGAVALFTALSGSAFAQFETKIHWESSPKIHAIPDSFKKYSAVYVLDQTKLNYRKEGNDYFVYKTVHSIVKVLDDKGIESFNKWSIPVYANRKT